MEFFMAMREHLGSGILESIVRVANIPKIQAQSDLISKVLKIGYVDNAGINEFEEIFRKLWDLTKYIPRTVIRYDTNFMDELLSIKGE